MMSLSYPAPINLIDEFNQAAIQQPCDGDCDCCSTASLNHETKQVINSVCNRYNDLLDDIDDNPSRTSQEKDTMYRELDKVAWSVISFSVPHFVIPQQDLWMPILENAKRVSQQWQKYTRIHRSISKFEHAFMNLMDWIYRNDKFKGVEYYSDGIGYHYN